jgi:plastocyanin
VRRGRGLTFVNRDARREIFHTITACRAPCNRTTGIAYPLADGKVDFDSGELGFGPKGFTAAANRDTWTTPKRLRPGTYTYFCRVHPFMRGAFKVAQRKR